MNGLEKILEEIDREEKNALLSIEHTTGYKAGTSNMANTIKDIIRKHMNDGWIPVEERLPEKEYETVLCVTDKNHYFVGVYNHRYGFRTGDIEAEGKVIAWRPLPECFLASNFPHFHRYDSLKSALYIHAVSKNINTFPKNQGRIRAAIAVEILDFTVMYR